MCFPVDYLANHTTEALTKIASLHKTFSEKINLYPSPHEDYLKRVKMKKNKSKTITPYKHFYFVINQELIHIAHRSIYRPRE